MNYAQIITKCIKNSSWLALEKFLKAITSIFIGFWVIRYLGPEDFGLLSYTLSFLVIFQSLAVFGLEAVVVKKFVDSKKDNNLKKIRKFDQFNIDNCTKTIIGTVFILRISFGFLAYILFLVIAYITQEWSSEKFYIYIIIGLILVVQSLDVIDLFFQAELRNERTVKSKILAYTISSCIKIIFIQLELNVVWFAFAHFLEFLLISIFLIISYLNYVEINQIKINININIKTVGIPLLKDGFPIMIAGFCAAIYSKFDIIFLNKYYNEAQIGIYSAMANICTAIYFIPGLVSASILPILINVKKKSNSIYIKSVIIVYSIITFIALIIIIIITLNAEYIIIKFLNDEYINGKKALIIYSFTILPVFIGVTNSVLYVIEQKTYLILYRAIVGAVTSVILCYSLIPSYGIEGAALATLLSFIVADIIMPIIIILFNMHYKMIK